MLTHSACQINLQKSPNPKGFSLQRDLNYKPLALLQQMTPSRIRTLAYIVWCFDRMKTCSPSEFFLARGTNLHEDTVSESVIELKQAGLIDYISHLKKRNIYKLTFGYQDTLIRKFISSFMWNAERGSMRNFLKRGIGLSVIFLFSATAANRNTGPNKNIYINNTKLNPRVRAREWDVEYKYPLKVNLSEEEHAEIHCFPTVVRSHCMNLLYQALQRGKTIYSQFRWLYATCQAFMKKHPTATVPMQRVPYPSAKQFVHKMHTDALSLGISIEGKTLGEIERAIKAHRETPPAPPAGTYGIEVQNLLGKLTDKEQALGKLSPNNQFTQYTRKMLEREIIEIKDKLALLVQKSSHK